MIIAQTASNAEGTPAPTWTVVQTNINGAVTTTNNLVDGKLILGAGNKAIKNAGGTGFVKVESGSVIYDTNTYLTTTSASSTYATKTDLSSLSNNAVTTSGQLENGRLIIGNGNKTIRTATTSGFVTIKNGVVNVDGSTYLKSVPKATTSVVGGGKVVNVYNETAALTNTDPEDSNVTLYGLQIDKDGNFYTPVKNPATYSLHVASSTTLGGIKIGFTKNDNAKNYPVELSGDKAYVHVPWTDTNTTYPLASASTNGLMSKDDKSKLDDLSLSGNSFNDTLTNTKGLTLNLVGTSSSYNIPIVKPSTDASTYGLMSGADKKKLDGIAEDANKYSLPAANANDLGGIRIGYSPLAGTKNYPVVLDTNNKAYVSVPWTDNNTTYTADGVYVTLTSGQFSLARDKKTLINNAVQRSEIGAIPKEEITKLF